MSTLATGHDEINRPKKEESKLKKELDKKFGKNKYLVPIMAALYPMSAEREYKRLVDKYVGEINKIIKRLEYRIGHGYSKKAAVTASQKELDKLNKKFKLKDKITKIGQLVRYVQLEELDKAVKKTFGTGMKKDKRAGAKERDEWIEETILIFMLLSQNVETALKAVEKSKDAGTAKEFVSKVKDEMWKFSGNMAVEQTGNLYYKVTFGLFKFFGIDRYKWKTKNDSRVRECHASFNGKIFRVDDPPEIWYRTSSGIKYTGRHCHPGQDFNCRCTAIPVFNKLAIFNMINGVD